MFGSSGTLNLGTAWRTHRMRLGDHSRDGVVSLVKICSSGPFLICKKEGGREMGGERQFNRFLRLSISGIVKERKKTRKKR